MPAKTSGKGLGTATKHAKLVVLQPNSETEAATSGKARGTATKHAKRCDLHPNPETQAATSGKGRDTATKHAKRLVLHPNPETQQFIETALADRGDDSPEHLQFKLNDFLRHVFLRNYPWLS